MDVFSSVALKRIGFRLTVGIMLFFLGLNSMTKLN